MWNLPEDHTLHEEVAAETTAVGTTEGTTVAGMAAATTTEKATGASTVGMTRIKKIIIVTPKKNFSKMNPASWLKEIIRKQRKNKEA
jgi:hypothetical protein